MHMPRQVISLPPNKDVPAAAEFTHSTFMVPAKVTLVNLYWRQLAHNTEWLAPSFYRTVYISDGRGFVHASEPRRICRRREVVKGT
jgi:hypothetical protein